MVEGQDEERRAAYSCSVGDTAIWRRQPHQLQSTLAFMLGRDEGRLFKVPSWEQKDVKKCLQWLKENNPHVRLLMTNAERFGDMYKRLQALVPQGRADAPVRLKRTHSSSSAMESTLGDTIGAEEAVLERRSQGASEDMGIFGSLGREHWIRNSTSFRRN